MTVPQEDGEWCVGIIGRRSNLEPWAHNVLIKPGVNHFDWWAACCPAMLPTTELPKTTTLNMGIMLPTFDEGDKEKNEGN